MGIREQISAADEEGILRDAEEAAGESLSAGSETDQTSSNADLSGCVAAFPV